METGRINGTGKTEHRFLTCINCPLGCALDVELADGEVVRVTGNTCPRGEAYGRKEVTHPTRIVTSSVFVTGSKTGAYTVSVKTASDVPKEKIFDVIRDIRNISVPCPVHIGDVILENAAGCGVNVIATKEVV